MADLDLTREARAQVMLYAGEALGATIQANHEAANEAVQRICEDHGVDGLQLAILAWCNTLIHHNPLPAAADGDPDGPVLLAWITPGAGGVLLADDLPPADRWAGQLLMARAQKDVAMFNALLRTVPPGDDQVLTEHINALLLTVAATLTAVHAGKERFWVRLEGGPLAGDRLADNMTWPLPDVLPLPDGLGGRYVKVSESQLPPQDEESKVLRGARYAWRRDDEAGGG
jgi:hypothetical protein